MERRESSTETITTASSLTENGSSLTGGSIFTDSAVDMDATTTPLQTDATINKHEQFSRPIEPAIQTLSDRLKRLSVATWALEHNDNIPEPKHLRIEQNLRSLEAIIEGVHELQNEEEESLFESLSQQDISVQSKPILEMDEEDEEDSVDEADLFQVNANIAEVVASIRLRQQEQRHLHQLTATKLEAIAQRCLIQEQQMLDLAREMQSLREENRSLGQENDQLRDKIAEVEVEASQREVAVSAMTSAVAGLEGWIDDTEKAHTDNVVATSPAQDSRPRRTVVRGKGRFRGRYYVDEETDHYFAESTDAREIQDGVRAWIRGFRDVEDACSSPGPGHVKDLFKGRVEDDEWGDFESPGSSFQ